MFGRLQMKSAAYIVKVEKTLLCNDMTLRFSRSKSDRHATDAIFFNKMIQEIE